MLNSFVPQVMSRHLRLGVTAKMISITHAIANNSNGRVLMIAILGSGRVVRKLARSVINRLVNKFTESNLKRVLLVPRKFNI